jgi:hypothetical protein
MTGAQHALKGIVIRAGLGWTLWCTVLAMIVSSFAFAVSIAYGRAGDMQGLALSIGAGGLLSAALIWYVVELWVGQVEFGANELVRKSAFGSTLIPLSQIVSYRRVRHRYGQFLRLLNAEGQTLLLLDSMTTEFAIVEEWAIENLVDAS